MASNTANVNLKDAEGLVLNVTVRMTREFRLRLWVAMRLIHIASIVLNAKVKFVAEEVP